ncbi:MAG: MMPL family transporter, partial [Acidimicrobiales bacterium]
AVDNALERLARFCARNRGPVVAAWLGLAITLTIVVAVADIEPRSELRVPGTDSQVALDLLDEHFPEFAGTSAQVVFYDPDGVERHVDRIVDMLRRVAILDDVSVVSSPTGPGVVSPDGTTAIVTVRYRFGQADLAADTYADLVETVEVVADDELTVEVGGALGFFDAQETGGAERLGFVAAVIILLFAFGSLIAMGMPLLAALAGLGVGLALVNFTALFVDMPESALTLVTMIGIGVGIDYALFIVSRFRELRSRYRSVHNAIAQAASTAGKAVVFAGGTVMVSILGLAISGVPFVAWMGFAAAIVVAVMVLVAITFIPALLAFAGNSIDRFQVPFISSEPRPSAHVGWVRWGRHVSRHPWPYLVVGVSLLAVLAVPLFSMRLGQSDAGNLPKSTGHRRAYDLIAEGFGPGFNGPLLVAIDTSERDRAVQIEADVAAIEARDDVVVVTDPLFNSAGDTVIFSVIPVSAPEDVATEQLVADLREVLLPGGVESAGASAHVAGATANSIDLADRIGSRLPWFIGAVVAASFVLLAIMFRSLVVPLKAAVLNLLSIGAAYGVIVAIFQWGWGKSLVGLEDTVPITSVVPMFMFAVLFGLSMDYEVFLLSRVREEYDLTGDNTESVVQGLAATGRIITSAALIMVAVFFGFVLSDDPLVKMAGVGLGTAILLDATVVRVMLVPSSMQLMGSANWW